MAKRKQVHRGEPNLQDWRSIENEREKYSAYLCSREWCEKREKVRERAGGMCERCEIIPMDSCHHLSYARKYHEELEDLQAICDPCHKFTHGKSNIDPVQHRWWLMYVSDFRDCPVPESLAALGVEFCEQSCASELRGVVVAMKMIVANRTHLIEQGALDGKPGYLWSAFLTLTTALGAIDRKIGFELAAWIIQEHGPIDAELYQWSMAIKWNK